MLESTMTAASYQRAMRACKVSAIKVNLIYCLSDARYKEQCQDGSYPSLKPHWHVIQEKKDTSCKLREHNEWFTLPMRVLLDMHGNKENDMRYQWYQGECTEICFAPKRMLKDMYCTKESAERYGMYCTKENTMRSLWYQTECYYICMVSKRMLRDMYCIRVCYYICIE